MTTPTKTTATHPETQSHPETPTSAHPGTPASKTPAMHLPDAPGSHGDVRGTDPVRDSLHRIERTLAAMRGEQQRGGPAALTFGAARDHGVVACAAIEAGLQGLDLPPGRLEAAVTIVRGALLRPTEAAVTTAREAAPLRP